MKTPKQMALEYAHKNQLYWDGESIDHHIIASREMAFLAGYQAAKNSPEKQDSCEHILDMEKMVDVNLSSEWISVKERLPEELQEILWCHAPTSEMAVGQLVIAPPYFTHWMPLPKPPEE